VVVLVLVVVRAVLELAKQCAGVVMGHVVVVVGMHDPRMGVFVLRVVHHPLHHGCLLHGELTSFVIEVKGRSMSRALRLQERRAGCGTVSEPQRARRLVGMARPRHLSDTRPMPQFE
jgi:hypothetical protein